MQQTFKVPIARIVLAQEADLFFVAQSGFIYPDLRRHPSFTEAIVRSGKLLVVPDPPNHPEFGKLDVVNAQPGVRFLAGAPLVSHDGYVIGSLNLVDSEPREVFDEAQQAMLTTLAALVMDKLELNLLLRRNQQKLEQAELRERLVAAAIEAEDFKSAIQRSAQVLLEATNAKLSHVFRQPRGTARLRFVGGIGGDAMARIDEISPWELFGPDTIDDLSFTGTRVLRVQSEASGLAAHIAQDGPATKIVTTLGLLDERYLIVVGFDHDPPDIDHLCDVMAEAAVSLRPLLRRFLDEETALLFRRALDASSDPILITEGEPIELPGPRIVYANAAFEALTGYSLDDIKGLSPRKLAGPDTSAAARANIRKALQAWQPIRQELLNYKKDGTPFMVELSIAPVADSTGWYTHWIALQRDVTERRLGELTQERAISELRTLISMMPSVLMRFGPSPATRIGQLLYAAPTIEAVTGFTPEEAQQPGWIAQNIHPGDVEKIIAHRERTAIDGEVVVDFRFFHKNRLELLIEARIRRITNPDGSIEYLALWSDITREHHTEAMLAQSAKLAQLGELATGMAHELNQPLAAVSMAAENALNLLSRAANPTPNVREKLDKIVDMTHRAAQIIEHMRVFGRIAPDSKIAVDFADLVTKMLELVAPRLRETHTQLQLELPPDLPKIVVQPVPLEQVLINLITNACDAYLEQASHEWRKIVISARFVDSVVEVQVQDFAGGIPEQLLPRVFQPFVTSKPIGQGTGLGLSVSYGIITELGGTIAVENVNGGARFTLTLPCEALEQPL